MQIRDTDQPYVLGITGNIACGKTLVLQTLASLGADTIDADKIYHTLIEPDQPLWQELVKHFGEGILTEQRAIDRKKLGGIVFSSPAALAELEQITHPAIRHAIQQQIAASPGLVVAIDAVKLIESGFHQFCDQVWLVVCDPEQQRARLIRRNSLSETEADRRIAAQPSIDSKMKHVDVVIDNSGLPEETKTQIISAWQQLPPHRQATHSTV